MKKSYRATAYRQATDPSAPWIISLVAPAEEILDWAGIPRRTEDAEMAGFQRAYDPGRVERAKEFFDIGVNQSPTTIVVGIHPQPEGADCVRLIFDASENDGTSIRPCTLEIEFSQNPDVAEVVQLVKAQISARLDTPPDDEEEEFQAEDSSAEDEEEDDEEEDTSDSRQIELGKSLLVALQRRLDDPRWCSENFEHLRDLAKPATVIDGQHRLKGAERCEREIPFGVCALYPCPWAEQVFQFTVVNYTQKGIPDQFITANAALSLTRSEMGELQDRLVQAGVHVTEYDLMKVVHFDDSSPFRGLVNLTEKKDPTKIGYKTMVRVASEWFNGSHQVFKTFLERLYPDLPGKRNHKARVRRWREGDWGLFFLDFWRIVHDSYSGHSSDKPGHKLWDVSNSNLIVAIVLFELQAAFLDTVNAQDEVYWDYSESGFELRREEYRERWKKRARIFVGWFPPEFFATAWRQKSLSIGPGRVALRACFGDMVKSKGTYQYAKCSLITG